MYKDSRGFDEDIVEQVWQKGYTVVGCDPREFRKDIAGAWMYRHAHGSDSDLGWEIDHCIPSSRGGSDDLSNLQPLQWRNNKSKSDDYPVWTAKTTSSGSENIECSKKIRQP